MNRTTSTAPSPIAVTGSTGALGGLVTRHLAKQGIPQRLLVRNPARAREMANSEATELPEKTGSSEETGFSQKTEFPEKTGFFEAPYDDHEAVTEALRGVQTLFMVSAFMVSASESEDRLSHHLAFVDAAAAAGVGHVVYTSFLGAAPDAVFTLARTHHGTEERIRTSGMDWTFLRDSFYADFTEAMVGEDGVIRGPAGQGRCAFVARADVAKVAAAVLADPAAHAGQTYDLTGPRSLTMAEVAATIARVRGGKVSFHDESVPEAYESRTGYDAPRWQLDAWVSTYTAIAAGELDVVSDAIPRITGDDPLSLEQLLTQD